METRATAVRVRPIDNVVEDPCVLVPRGRNSVSSDLIVETCNVNLQRRIDEAHASFARSRSLLIDERDHRCPLWRRQTCSEPMVQRQVGVGCEARSIC